MICSNCSVELHVDFSKSGKSTTAYYAHCPTGYADEKATCPAHSIYIDVFCKKCYDEKADVLIAQHIKDFHISIDVI